MADGILETSLDQGIAAQGLLENAAIAEARRKQANAQSQAEEMAAVGQIAGTVGGYYATNRRYDRLRGFSKQGPFKVDAKGVPILAADHAVDGPAAKRPPITRENASLFGDVIRGTLTSYNMPDEPELPEE